MFFYLFAKLRHFCMALVICIAFNTKVLSVEDALLSQSDDNKASNNAVIDSTPVLIKEVVLGASLPLSGGLGLIGNDLRNGYDLLINKTNKSGGLNKKYPIKLYVLDDENKSELAKKNFLVLTRKTNLIAATMGAESLQAMLQEQDTASNETVFFLFPITNHNSTAKANVFSYRPSFYREIEALIHFSIRKMFRKNIAVFYEDSLFGEQALACAKKCLARYKVKNIVAQSYPKNSVSVMPAVRKISEKMPNAILCLSHCYPTYNFIQQMMNAGFSDCLFLGLSFLTPIQKILLKSRGITIILSSVVPNPWKSKINIVDKYRQDMQRFMPKSEFSSFGLEGYICSNLILPLLDAKLKKNLAFLEVLQQEVANNALYEGLSLQVASDSLSSLVWINDGPDKDWQPFKITEKVLQQNSANISYAADKNKESHELQQAIQK